MTEINTVSVRGKTMIIQANQSVERILDEYCEARDLRQGAILLREPVLGIS